VKSPLVKQTQRFIQTVQGSRPIATSFELVLPSCPLKGSSNFPQNFKQFIILDNISVF